MAVGRHLEDVPQRLSIAADLCERDAVGSERRVAVQRRGGVILCNDVALDAVGPPDGASEHRAAQATLPATRNPEHDCELPPHRVDLIQDGHVLGRRELGKRIDESTVSRCRDHKDSLDAG